MVAVVARILVLEDDRALALDLERGLSPFGCEVIVVGDGSVGLARAVAEHVDLVVVSAELRGTNGFRVCNRLKKYGGDTRVPVIITWTEASASAREEHARLATAADAYIKKPFGPSELRGQVRAHVPALAVSHPSSTAFPAVRISAAPQEPSERPGRLVSGFTSAVAEPIPQSPASLARFDRELASAVREQAALEDLRRRLSELEAENAKLVHDLNAARARSAAPPRPPPLPRPDASRERELAAMRDAVAKKDAEIVALKRELEVAPHAPPPESAQRTATLRASLEKAEKTIAALRGETDAAKKSKEQLEARLEKTRADLANARAELAEQKTAFDAESTRHAQALEKQKTAIEAARRAGEAAAHAQLSTELDAKVARVAEDLAAEHAAKLVELQKDADRHAEELAAKIAEVESARREANAQLERERRERAEAEKARTAQRAAVDAEIAAAKRAHAEALAARAAEHETKLAEMMMVQTELQASMRTMQAKLGDVEAAREARAKELEALRVSHAADVSALEAKLSEASASLSTSESSLAEATAARSALETEAAALRAARSELEIGRAAAEKELRETTVIADRYERRANELEWELAAAQARAAESEAAVVSTRAEALTAVEAARSERVKELEAALAEAEAKTEAAFAAAETHRNELESVRATLEERARDLAEARRAKETTNRTIVALHASAEKLRTAQKSAEAARTDAEERARLAVTELGDARAAIEKERAVLERMRGEIAENLARGRAASVETEAQQAARAELEARLRDQRAAAEQAIEAAEAGERELVEARAALARLQEQSADLEEERGRLMARAASAERARAAAEATLDIQTRSSKAAREAAAAQFARELKRAADAHATAEQSMRESAAKTEESLRASHAEEIARVRAEAGAGSSATLAAAEARFEERLADLTKQLEAATIREGEARAEMLAERSRREELEDRVSGIESLVARTRESLDAERAERLRIEASLTAMTTEMTEAVEEVSALEAEIAALRSELSAARTKIDNESALAKAAQEELEKNRKLIERARALLADLVDPKDRENQA